MHKTKIFRTLITLFVLLILYHIGILINISDTLYVWGSQVNNSKTLLYLELFAIFILLLAICIVSLKMYMKPSKWVDIGIWFFIVVFSLSTVANLLADNWFERGIGTPLAAFIAYMLFKLKKV